MPKFNKTKLLAMIDKNYEDSVQRVRERYGVDDAEHIDGLRTEWREEIREQAEKLANNIDGYSDDTLIQWRFPSSPVTRAERAAADQIENLAGKRDRRKEYINSRDSNDGWVTLTQSEVRMLDLVPEGR